MTKKKIQLCVLAAAGMFLMSSCVVIDALQKSWEFQKNHTFETGGNGSAEAEPSESTAPDGSIEPDGSMDASEEAITEDQRREREAFEAYLDELFVEALMEDPFQIHFFVEDTEAYGVSIEQYVLVDTGEQDEEQLEEEQELMQFDTDLLSDKQKLLYEKLLYNWEWNASFEDVIDYGSYIGGSNGIVFSLADSFYEYAFYQEKDIEDYLKFLEDIPNYISFAIAQTEEQIDQQYVPSKYMLETNIEQIDTICSGEDNLFLSGFEQKIGEASFLSDEQREAYREENKITVEETVMPAFSRLKTTLETWKEELPEYEGLYAMEGGTRYYEYLAAYYSGSEMSVNEMYRYLVKKMDQCEEELSAIFSRSFSLYQQMRDGRYGLTLTEPEDILNALRQFTGENYPSYSDPGYRLSWLPKALQSEGLLAYYLVPQIDQHGFNEIRLNSQQLDGDLMQLTLTLAHEGYPGHLYASNYISQQGWHPLNSLLDYPAYTEGWAEYASMDSLRCWDLTSEMPSALLCNEMLGYALQAVTDIGIHYKGWTLEDMKGVWGNYYEIEEEEIKEIYDYFLANPGVILSYAMGFFQIADLQAEVSDILGRQFDEQEFLQAFLDVGGAPFSIVEEYVIEWATQKVS